MSARKLKVIRLCLLAYVVLTFFEVATHREDWPLSCFPMFSGLQQWGSAAQRTTLVGVTDQGEFTVEPSSVSGLMSAARLRMIFGRMRKASAAEQARFTGSIAKLLKGKTKGQQEIWGLRFYIESWKAKPRLQGIRRPTRKLEFAEFLPPDGLLAELRNPGESAPVALPDGDWLAELAASDCVEGCAAIEAPGASGGEALRLSPRQGEEPAALRLEIPEGTANVFVRLRTEASSGDDVLQVTLDGATPTGAAQGLGNYKHDLPYDTWVWVSLAPGWPPLRLDASAEAKRELVLRAERGVLDIDQVWLARTRKEVPVFAAAVGKGP